MTTTRLTLWFATAYTIVILVHEAAHGLVARAVGLHATLFHFWVDIDRNNEVWQRALFGSAGPLSSVLLGVVAWFAYRAARPPATAVPLLLLAACGVSNFFGNLMSAAFVGDFSNVSVWLGLPMSVRYALSVSGLLGVASVLFVAGRELRRWIPADWPRSVAAALGVVVPVGFGTLIIIVINQPVAIPGFAVARAGEAAVWVFAVAGIALATPPFVLTRIDGLTLTWLDIAIALMVLAIVRMLVPGVPLP